MEQKVSNKAGWFTLISFICGVITLLTFEEMDSSVKTIEALCQIVLMKNFRKGLSN